MKHIPLMAVVWVGVFATVTVMGQTAKSVNEGVFTTAQATRGAAVFKSNCTTCHDAARFTGDDFLSVWTGKPVHALFHHMSVTMPEDNPGALKPQQYADVIAYFLELNGYPAGEIELQSAADGLKAIKFDKPLKK